MAEGNPGFPGYAGEIQSNVVTLAEIFRSNGYSTLLTGKVKPKTFHVGDLVLEPDILPLVSDRNYTIQVKAQYKTGDRAFTKR